MTNIERLNLRLQEALGTVNGGPRFMWRRATECFYFRKMGYATVAPQDGGVIASVIPTYQRFCWAARIGDVWCIAQWRPPAMSPEEWEASKIAFAYPAKGLYYAMPELQLKQGDTPDDGLTDWIIKLIQNQKDKTEADFFFEARNDMDDMKEKEKEQKTEEILDAWPAFNNGNPGLRGGDVVFGGYSEAAETGGTEAKT